MPDAIASADQRLPIYQRLKDAFAARIAQRQWRPGEAIPPESELAAEFGVALGTVRKAIDGLVQLGLIDRRQGRGTFVRRADFGNALIRFFRHTTKDGRPLQPQGRLLARRVAPAGGEPARALAIAPDADTLWLSRLRLIGDAPILVEDIALPLDRFRRLVDLPSEAFGDLLYPLYERECGEEIARAREHIAFARANATTARTTRSRQRRPRRRYRPGCLWVRWCGGGMAAFVWFCRTVQLRN